MKKSYKSIKIQTCVYKQVMKIKKAYHFIGMSETIQFLIGNTEVKRLLTEEDVKQLALCNDQIKPDEMFKKEGN